MRRLCLAFVLILGTLPLFAAGPYAPAEKRLANGARLIVLPKTGSGAVAIAVAVAAGSAVEPPSQAGLSHYLEHLCFDGYDQLTESDLTLAFRRGSAYVNAFTREETTVFFALAPKDKAPALARHLAGMLTRSKIDEKVFAKERGVMLEELAKDQSRPDTVLDEALRRALWKGTLLELPVSGTKATIEATSLDELKRYYRSRYTAGGFRILVAGDGTAIDLEKIASPFAELPKHPAPKPPEDPNGFPGFGKLAVIPLPGGATPTLEAVIALPEETKSAEAALLSRYLGEQGGRIHEALVGPIALSLDVSRLARTHRDLLDLRLKIKDGIGPKKALDALAEALAGLSPSLADLSRLQEAASAERSLTSQRLHYMAVFYGEDLASARGSLLDALAPPPVKPAAFTALAQRLPTFPMRAAFAGRDVEAEVLSIPRPEQVTGGREAQRNGPEGIVTLPNGMELQASSEPGNDVFGLCLLVEGRALREGTPGVADLLHRWLPHGTLITQGDSLGKRINRLGIKIKTADNPFIPFDNYYNSPAFSYIRMEGPASSFSEGLALLAELVKAPSLDAKGFDQAKEEFRQARRNAKPNRLLERLLGKEHPFARPVAGQEKAPVPTAEEVKKLLGRWPTGYFSPPHLILGIVSPLPAEEAIAVASDLFSDGAPWKPKRILPKDPQQGAASTQASATQSAKASPQTTIAWGYLATVKPEDRPPLLMALDLLTARMVREIREKRGLAYRLGAGASPWPDGRWLLRMSVGTRPSNEETVSGLMKNLLEELGEQLPTEGEIRDQVAGERLHLLLRGLSAESRAYRLARELLDGEGSPQAVSPDALARVSPEDIARVCRRYLDLDTFRR